MFLANSVIVIICNEDIPKQRDRDAKNALEHSASSQVAWLGKPSTSRQNDSQSAVSTAHLIDSTHIKNTQPHVFPPQSDIPPSALIILI